ncbi:MAG TPA: ATP-binding protein [Candidatus Acidoferrales bacterium]|nr:ATP-binding protein [Candidatus Acidoferrales bacterium]
MTFRTKLFFVFTLALLVSVGVIVAGVTITARNSFEQLNAEHTNALIEQFKREYARRETEVVTRVHGVAEDSGTVTMAMNLARPAADVSVYVNDAQEVARAHQLDFLDFLGDDGSIISSYEWPARFGYKLTWVTEPKDWSSTGAFLTRVDTQNGAQVGLLSVTPIRVGDKNLYVVGGERLEEKFLSELVLPQGMRALLYLNLDQSFQAINLIDVNGPVVQGDPFTATINEELARPSERTFTIPYTPEAGAAEVFHALPLQGRNNQVFGVLLVGNSQRDLVLIERRIALLGAAVLGGGLLLGLLLSWWAAARVTKPVRKLAAGAQRVSQGDLGSRVEARGPLEMMQLARSFNHMTDQLNEQRERLVQAERVAAWRELARRLAHELKNPLFPLQTTVQNMQRAKEMDAQQFEEVFRESTGILLSEIDNLKKIVSRFSDFARMPQPELAAVNVNDLARGTAKLFESQFSAVGRPPITSELHLNPELPVIEADSTLLKRALENLVLNAMDAMPAGGVLMLRTAPQDGGVHLEVSDTGTGLTPEECDRLFTPYYTTKQHGTGLGLAIVQSVVSDHGGRISVESEAGVGTSFHIFLPMKPPPRPVDHASSNGDGA